MNFKGVDQRFLIMDEQTFTERRQYQRYPMPTSIQFFHGPLRREISSRCVDISSGGMLMTVPPNIPVRPGQYIRVTGANFSHPEFMGLSEKSLDATIVRVNREKLLSEGNLAVGVRFSVATK